MSALFNRVRILAGNPWFKWLVAPAMVVAVVSSVVGVTTLPPTVSLAAEPLYARGARAKPTLSLVLSVEFPTVGAQFLGTGGNLDDTYNPAVEYLGYFDTASCYAYIDVPTETRPTGFGEADYKRFDRIGAATIDSTGNRACNTSAGNTGFAGNFMNWASSSAIDILRRGLSGGDRILDTSIVNGGGLTVLQRAVLPTGFWNSNNFPAKKLKAALAPGAVPPLLRTTTTGANWTGDIFVANCLNRMHFGTTQTGSCSAPGANADLGVKMLSFPTNGLYSGTLPVDFNYPGSPVASENGVITPPLTTVKQIAYGANTSWSIKTLGPGAVTCNNATFGDPIVGTAKKCYQRDPPSAGSAPGITADGFVYSRVRVCDSNSSGLLDPRKDLCLQYPNGSFKPVGNLQKYSDRVRVAAFGYLNDSTGNPNQRYGGVLRAPMKYVGAKSYDQNFALEAGANARQEWNETTGELIANPDAALEPRSGVINYLNQFGRTGPTPGTYKTYDPVSELYYEALRYLQGLPPTADATSGTITDTMKDGFPYYTTWADPHPKVSGMTDYSCVKNSIVGIGDANTHNDKTIPGNTRTTNDAARAADAGGDPTSTTGPAANLPDFMKWTNVVGGFESGGSVPYVDGKAVARTTTNPKVVYPGLSNMSTRDIGADRASYYIAGMAYWANTHDIRGSNWTDLSSNPSVADTLLDKRRPGMRVTTYFLDVNEYGSQNNLATRQQNQFFLAAKYGGFTDYTGTGNPFKVVGDGSTTKDGNDYWEAAPVGSNEAKNYFLSSSAKAVLDALDTIFASVAKQANSIAGAAASSQQVTTTDSYIYQSQFDPADWSGDVTATSVSAAASGGAATVGSSAASAPFTSVATVLAKKGAANRKIYVGGGSSTTAAVPFLWATVPTYVKVALQTPLGGTSATDTLAVAEQRLDYLRGDQTREAAPGTFRKRTKLLGDIINSAVAYSGATTSTKKALYVGANDGMLHAFDASNGDELFAYIPSWVVPKLSALTSPAYIHQSYVDASPVVADAKIGSTVKTVLVSGTGGGGQGVFALDVSNPEASSFDASKVLWEFSDADDVDLGNVIGKPRILSFNTTGTGSPKTFAVVASGVNNHAVDGRQSLTARNALFFFDLSKPATSAWVLNTNYFKIVFPVPSSSAIANGMANFTARSNTLGQVTAIYAGDLQGNLWKLDFTKATGGTADWTIDKLSAFADTSSGRKAKPFYIAKDGETVPSLQPITMEPTLLYGPNNSVIVTFGTGKYLEVSDTTGSYKTQSVYAVMDDGTAKLDVTNTLAIAGRGRLQPGTVSAGTVTVPPFLYGRPTADSTTVASPTEYRAGWYFDFPGSSASGERQISDFAVAGSTLAFGSVIPSLNSCDSGSGNLYFVNGLTGSGNLVASTDGIFGPPIALPVADSSTGITVSGSTGLGTQTIRYGFITPTSSSDPDYFKSPPVGQNIGRLSWREINNYQSLKP